MARRPTPRTLCTRLVLAGLTACAISGVFGLIRPESAFGQSKKPDLVIFSVSLTPTSLSPGTAFTATVKVKNRGKATAESTTTAVYVATSFNADPAKATSLGSLNTDTINAGVTKTLTFKLSVPPATPGTYYLLAQADIYKTVTESSETNNGKSAKFQVTAPDLVVSGLTLTPTTLSPGDSLTVSVQVKNQGTATTGATTTEVYMASSPDADLNTATPLGSLNLDSLSAGASKTQTLVAPVPAVPAGTYYLIAQADISNTALESNETSNRGSVQFQVTVPVSQPTSVEVAVMPGDDLAALVSASPEGTVFRLKAGVHRLQMVAPKNYQSFLGDPGAILSGAKLLTSFTRQGSWWVASGQTQQGPVHGECEPDSPGCAYPEDLFVDDVLLQHVTSLSALGPGTWFFDYAQDKIYLADDPAGHRVETSVSRRAFYGSASNVTLRGLIIEKYANEAQHGAIHGQDPATETISHNWVVEANELRWNHGAGLIIGHGMQVLDNLVYQNGQIGIAGIGDDVLIDGNEIAFNNTSGFNWEWEAGGTKFVKTRRLVVRNNFVHDNVGPGLWTDIDNLDTLVEGNYVANNIDSGIFHEISYAAVIRYNTVVGNGFGRCNWLWGSGILIAASPNVEVYGNTVSHNCSAIGAIQQDRGTGLYGPHEIANLYVDGNTITQADGVAAGLVQDIGDQSYFTSRNNWFVQNTYKLTLAPDYAWMDSWISAAQWQGYGQDAGGVWLP